MSSPPAVIRQVPDQRARRPADSVTGCVPSPVRPPRSIRPMSPVPRHRSNEPGCCRAGRTRRPRSWHGSGGICSTAAGCASGASRRSTRARPPCRSGRRACSSPVVPTGRWRRSPTSAAIAATSCWPAGRRAIGAWCSARTTRGRTSSTGGCGSAPHAGPDVVADELGLLPVRHPNGAGGCSSTSTAQPSRSRTTSVIWPHWPRHGAPPICVVGATHHYELAANWKVAIENYHECYHCPLIHPELCRVSPSTSGVNVAERRGAFIGGAMDLADGATTMSLSGESPLAPLPGLDRRASVARCCTCSCSPTCCSACTRTT